MSSWQLKMSTWQLKMSTCMLLVSWISATAAQCGDLACPSWGEGLSVHLVAHSHDDVGWLKTVDQYYQGSNREGWVDWEENQRAGVQYTLDTVIQELAMDPNKKFIQVEVAFFLRWWRQQEEEQQQLVRGLVRQGQLEFVGGGWSMNDEGATHYSAVVDNMGLGHRLLNDTFGECGVPRVAWQIDPFGHSKEQASLFSSMGLEGLFFARLDWRDKTNRERESTLEMVWEAGAGQAGQADLFTGVLYDHYGPPPGFCWDLLCNDAPIMEGEGGNLAALSSVFLQAVRQQAAHYRTNHIMLTMGMDFHYQAAHSWFLNLDRLIKHINQMEEGITLAYSTPSCYLSALHGAGQEWPTKQDDFFPYASDPHAHWTGYFSSRPTSKYMIRQTEWMAKVFNQMAALAKVEERQMKQLAELDRTVGIVQHHDAATGTEKQHVADDYSARMARGVEAGGAALGLAASYSLPYQPGSRAVFCPLLNISQCPPTEQMTMDTPLPLSLYSPLSRPVQQYVRIPLAPGLYQVTHEGTEVESQLVPLAPQVLSLPGRQSVATQELVFLSPILAPMALTHLLLYKLQEEQTEEEQELEEEEEYTLGRAGGLEVVGTRDSKGLWVRDSLREVQLEVLSEVLYYPAHSGNNTEFEFRASGAYIFRPKSGGAVGLGEHQDTVVKGQVVDEIVRTYSGADWVTQVVRVYHTLGHLEVSWLVGPLPVEDGVGKEVILRYSTSIESGRDFLTDSLGRQLLPRVRDFRPTFEINQTEPESQNYYPVAAKILLQDPSHQLAVLTDRPQGGSSLAPGSLELMLHRRLLQDDAFGVGEALNEEQYGQGLVATGRHRVLLHSSPSAMAADHRLSSLQLYFAPLLLLGPAPALPTACLTAPLSPALHILSLQPLASPTANSSLLLLHLEHVFEAGEHEELSLPVSLRLESLFSCLQLLSARETTVGGAMWRQQRIRRSWRKEGQEQEEQERQEQEQEEQLGELEVDEITLKPMEMRAFILSVRYLKNHA